MSLKRTNHDGLAIVYSIDAVAVPDYANRSKWLKRWLTPLESVDPLVGSSHHELKAEKGDVGVQLFRLHDYCCFQESIRGVETDNRLMTSARSLDESMPCRQHVLATKSKG